MSVITNTDSFVITSSSPPRQQSVGKQVKIPNPQPFIGSDDTSYEFTSYIDFVGKFKTQFVYPNSKATVARKPFVLKQRQEDIQTYLTKVISIARETDLGLTVIKKIIKENLNE